MPRRLFHKGNKTKADLDGLVNSLHSRRVEYPEPLHETARVYGANLAELNRRFHRQAVTLRRENGNIDWIWYRRES